MNKKWHSALIKKDEKGYVQDVWEEVDEEKFIANTENLLNLLNNISGYLGYEFSVTNELDQDIHNHDGKTVKWHLGNGFVLYETYKLT
jgi:hypothetical protein